MIFREFTGSEAVQRQIACFVAAGRLPHAIVLEGAPDAGALSLARDLAAALVCKGSEEPPCGHCPACKKVYSAAHPDVFEYVAKDAPRSFPVSVVRQVQADVFVVPNEADYKIYILGNASSMGREAQNALLKTLEEPPPNVILILTVRSKTLLLDTVLSRSVVFTLDEVKTRYEDNIPPIADAVGEALMDGNEYALLKALAPLEGSREEQRSLVEALTEQLRSALLAAAGIPSETSFGARLAAVCSQQQILALLQACSDIAQAMNQNANSTLVMSQLCCRLKQALLSE